MDLNTILPLTSQHDYKLHAARFNGTKQPLDVFLSDRDEWRAWNSWQSNKDDFNRDLILSLIDFYPEKDTWLFGGIYKVDERRLVKQAHSYAITLTDQGRDLIGRLKITGVLGRNRAFKLESVYHKLTVSEILKLPYSGEAFCGYENVSLDLSMLHIIARNNRVDWKTALESVKGVYVITDKLTGKLYIGSAYGPTGIWSRWSCYLQTGHGWNKELVNLSNADPSYALANFKITLIECWPFKTDDKTIRTREDFWKEAFLTRTFGYNCN